MAIDFDENEVGLAKRLVRVEIRRLEKKAQGMAVKFGDAYNPESADSKLALLEGMYRKLGGDPDNITVMESE